MSATASTASLVCELAGMGDRRAAAQRLAAHLGAEALIVFVRDEELSVFMPAPGFQSTMPGGPTWDALLASTGRGVHRGTVAWPDRATLAPVLALAKDDILFALLGGAPSIKTPADLALPLLSALFRAEQRALAAAGQSAASRDAARHASSLAGALDAARADVERALRAKQDLLRTVRESEARKTAVVRSSLDGIIATDHEGRILEFNPAAERLIGYRGADVVGKDLTELIVSPAQQGSHRARLTQLRDPATDFAVLGRFETSILRIDGSELLVEMAITRVELEGLPTFTSFIRDLTERKHAELERERLLGIVGHDLRNPLQAILMSASLLLKLSALPEGHLRALRRIQGSAERMSRLIADLLDFERGREGRLSLDRKPCRLDEIVAQAIEELEISHPTRAIRFQAQTAGAGSWDADRLTQVVSNLVGNAIQHGPPDAPIGVVLATRERGFALEVSNANRDGPVPADELPRLFEPFRRGKESTGLGLGLHIVQQIAHAHGGTVSAQSNAERTTFCVELP